MKRRRRKTLYVYADGARWYWAVIASNGQLLAMCPHEGFTRRRRAVASSRLLFSLAPVFDPPPYIPHRASLRLDMASLLGSISAPIHTKKGLVSRAKIPMSDMEI